MAKRGKSMANVWQKRGKTWQKHGKNVAKAWQKPWQKRGKNRGKNMAKTWQKRDKRVAKTWQKRDKRVAKTWQKWQRRGWSNRVSFSVPVLPVFLYQVEHQAVSNYSHSPWFFDQQVAYLCKHVENRDFPKQLVFCLQKYIK
jgi:hypothetical protein